MESTEAIQIDFNENYEVVLSSLKSKFSKHTQNSRLILEIRKCPSARDAVDLLLYTDFSNQIQKFSSSTVIKISVAKSFFVSFYDRAPLSNQYKINRILIIFELTKKPFTKVILWKNKSNEKFSTYTLGENFHKSVKDLIMNFIINRLKTTNVSEISFRNFNESTIMKFSELPDSFKFAIHNSNVLFQRQIVNLKEISFYEHLENLSSENIKSILKGIPIEIKSENQEPFIEREFYDENSKMKNLKEIITESSNSKIILMKNTKINHLKNQLKTKYPTFWILEVNFKKVQNIIESINRNNQTSIERNFGESSRNLTNNLDDNVNKKESKKEKQRSSSFKEKFTKFKKSLKKFKTKSSLDLRSNLSESSTGISLINDLLNPDEIEKILLEYQNLDPLESLIFSYLFKNYQVILLIDTVTEFSSEFLETFKTFTQSVSSTKFIYQIITIPSEQSEKFKTLLELDAKIYQIFPYTDEQREELLKQFLHREKGNQATLKEILKSIDDLKPIEVEKKEQAEFDESFLRQKTNLKADRSSLSPNLEKSMNKPSKDPKNAEVSSKTSGFIKFMKGSSSKERRENNSIRERENIVIAFSRSHLIRFVHYSHLHINKVFSLYFARKGISRLLFSLGFQILTW